MSRNALIGLLVALVVVGIPAVVVVAAGGGDEEPSAPAGTPTVAEGRPVAPVETDERGGPPARDDDGNRVRRRGGGPPADTVVYDGPPPEPRAIESALAGVGYPDALTPAGVAAATVVERRLGRDVAKGQPTVIAADCRGGVCSLRIRSEPRGTGRILVNQSLVLRGLFARREIKTVVLYVHHVIKGRDKNERPAFIKITCRRATHPCFRWSTLTPRQLPRRCRLSDQAGGNLRNQVRRGKLSNEQASKNNNAGTGSPGAPQKPIKPTAEQRREQRKAMDELRDKQQAERERRYQTEQEAGRAG
jgi:hypothetical protein